MGKTRRNFYIDDELYEEFKRLTSIGGVSMAEVVNESIREYNRIVKMALAGMSANEIIDFSHYKLQKAKEGLNHLKEEEGSEK